MADDGQKQSIWRVVGFATAVCIVCSVLVSGAAVLLGPRQEANRLADRQHKVLVVAGLVEHDATISVEGIQTQFAEHVRPRVVALPGAEYVDVEPERRTEDEHPVPPNPAGVTEVPDQILVYHVVVDGELSMVVLPIEGLGLWSTMRGYLAVATDGSTVRGINFYEHAETPGLGSEIDTPSWQGLWQGRRLFDDEGELAIQVKKGQAGPPSEAPHQVDAISGATVTSIGVNNAINFWLGAEAFGPLLERMRREATAKKGGAS